MRAPIVGGPQQKQSLLGTLLGNSHSKSTTFRIRRNKWSIIKFLLIATLSIYLILYIKSFMFHKVPDHVIDSKYEALTRYPPLNNPTVEQGKSEFQASPEPPYKLISDSTSKQTSTSISLRDSLTSQTFQMNPVRKKSRKMKLLANRIDIRKNRLDEQLKTLLPTISGWGDDGKGVKLSSAKDKEKAAQVFKQGAYNVYISDRISPNRSLHSVVAKECNDIKYNVEELPNVSVIIIFTNEIFSALIRTVWSVINRTPEKLLKEIILVDDFSDKDYLKQTLRDYIDIYWNTLPRYEGDGDLVKLVHLPSRLGLIKARLEGARMARGDVLLFLDSHCEATDLWIEPLVQRIKENNKVFICPVIDIINDKTLEYNAVDPYFFQLGGFDWTGHFTWINRREADAQREPTRATKSPTMAGGLFAVDRKYFFEIGSYDEDMKIWGGENLELSFRVWQCGGRIEIHPCSHVGHIFRDFHPYSFNGIDSHGFNTLRTVLVWMDEYSKYFFMSRPDLLKTDSGDLTARKKLRKNLNCSSFKWYLDNVYDKRKFIYDRDVRAYGWIKNKETDLCIDVLNKHETSGETAGLYTCNDMVHPLNVTTNQLFSYSLDKEIRREEGCLTVESESSRDRSDVDESMSSIDNFVDDQDKKEYRHHKVLLTTCEEPEYVSSSQMKRSLKKHKHQMWNHEPVGPRSQERLLVNAATGECLTTENGSSFSDLLVTACDRKDPRQYWEFQIYTDNLLQTLPPWLGPIINKPDD